MTTKELHNELLYLIEAYQEGMKMDQVVEAVRTIIGEIPDCVGSRFLEKWTSTKCGEEIRIDELYCFAIGIGFYEL